MLTTEKNERFMPWQWLSFSACNSTWTENWWLGKIEGRHMQSTVKQVLSTLSLCCFCSLHSHYFILFKSGEEISQWKHLLLLEKHGLLPWACPGPSSMPGITQLSMSTVITQFYPESTVLWDWTFLKKQKALEKTWIFDISDAHFVFPNTCARNQLFPVTPWGVNWNSDSQSIFHSEG